MPGDGGEVVHVEAVGVVAAVPAHDVEGVVVVGVAVDGVARLDADLVCAFLVEGHRELGEAEVALAIWGVLEELAGFLGDVARRREDVRAVGGLEADEFAKGHFVLCELLGPVRVGELVEFHAVDDALGDDDVVLGAERELAEHGLDRAGADVDEDALVALAVLEVVAHLLFGDAGGHLNVGVAEEHDAARDGVAFGLHRRRLEMTHAHGVDFDVLGLGGVHRLPSRNLCRGMDVVERAGRADETFSAEDFFGVERAVRPAELGVALPGEFAQLGVVRHV